MFIHKTKEGIKIPLSELNEDHLKNIIAYIKRKAKIGILFQNGGGQDSNDIWYNEERLYGKQIKRYLHYKKYKEELKKRNLKTKNNENR